MSGIAEFEQLVLHGQRPFEAAHYDESYFLEEWREGGNDYRVETRRAIEGKHPELIRDVFAPSRVLDVGCGPGALMFLLWELGVDVHGVDFAPVCAALAPPQIRDQITIGSIVDAQVFPDRAFDLVICREMIEHLTMLQVRKLVTNMCNISSRYLYVTTRFHPRPSTLFDVADELDVDPSHITLMNKDLLRLLIVLEGFRSRPDLEAKIDWMNKGRVLIYERFDTRSA